MYTPSAWVNLLECDVSGDMHLAWLEAVSVRPYKPASVRYCQRISLNTDDANIWLPVWLAFDKHNRFVQKSVWADKFIEWEDWIFLSDRKIAAVDNISCAIKSALHNDLQSFYLNSVDIARESLLEFIPPWALIKVLELLHTTDADIKFPRSNAKLFAALAFILDPSMVQFNTQRHTAVHSMISNSSNPHNWLSVFTLEDRNISCCIEKLAQIFPLSTYWYALTECMFEDDDSVIEYLIHQWPADVQHSWRVYMNMNDNTLLASHHAWIVKHESSVAIILPENLN
jgi:hypothetical protein